MDTGAPKRLPRAVIVTRHSLLTQLIERHGTFGQAEFFLKTRHERIEPLVEAHERVVEACKVVSAALAPEQRRASVDRDELDRFLFAPDDAVIVVGQDGLVANVAKYLKGQPVVGVNPDPERYDGVLCRHKPAAFQSICEWLVHSGDAFGVECRTLAVALREDGQRLLALNEVFVGHRSHQSARYRVSVKGQEERHSSSGMICSTGTGCTGWARSIAEQRNIAAALPTPSASALAWFVREPFPSVNTRTRLNFGLLARPESIEVISEMSEGGVIFADGIESDRIDFLSGQQLTLSVADETLNLVVPPREARKAGSDTGPTLDEQSANQWAESALASIQSPTPTPKPTPRRLNASRGHTRPIRDRPY